MYIRRPDFLKGRSARSLRGCLSVGWKTMVDGLRADTAVSVHAHPKLWAWHPDYVFETLPFECHPERRSAYSVGRLCSGNPDPSRRICHRLGLRFEGHCAGMRVQDRADFNFGMLSFGRSFDWDRGFLLRVALRARRSPLRMTNLLTLPSGAEALFRIEALLARLSICIFMLRIVEHG